MSTILTDNNLLTKLNDNVTNIFIIQVICVVIMIIKTGISCSACIMYWRENCHCRKNKIKQKDIKRTNTNRVKDVPIGAKDFKVQIVKE
jgi:hypothetical protein